jgi:UDP-N-acetylmuramoyl-L-alanyl-D-glutamate--2,6-diaminopimelate ligase
MNNIKKLIPEPCMSAYHKARALVAAAAYGFPARKMIVIGITGTKGKTSTANYVWSVMHAAGYKAGLISSANFRIDTIEEPNPYHMTMPDPFLIQKKMRDMVRSGITIMAMEMTSEGMKQHRHTGIPVDIAVFTNLTPEHLGSHRNDFERYKKAKSKLFRYALQHKNKVIEGKRIPRVIIANADSIYSTYYLQFAAEEKHTYGLQSGEVRAEKIMSERSGTSFCVGEMLVRLSIPGIFNIYNALPAMIAGRVLGIPDTTIREGLESLRIIPGRMELIDEGQLFTLVVDYAHEPASLGALLGAAESMKESSAKIILLTGVIGGGREPRIPLAKLGAEKAHMLIITNEDPYEKDPSILIEELAQAAESVGKKRDLNLFPILDRTSAIQKALSLAREGDIVLIAGKGAEQTMMTQTGALPWNERAIVRTLLKEHLSNKN